MHILPKASRLLAASLTLPLLHLASATPIEVTRRAAPVSRLLQPRLKYPTDLCSSSTSNNTTTTIPHLWSVQIHNITYSIPSNSPENIVPGTAVFSVTNTLSNSTNKIGCALRFDSLCEIKVEPNSGSQGAGAGEGQGVSEAGIEGEGQGVLDIHLQVLIEVAYVTVVQNVTCPANGTGNGIGEGEGGKRVSVGGMAEVYLGCDYEATPKRCWGEEGGWVDAEVLGEVPGGGTDG